MPDGIGGKRLAFREHERLGLAALPRRDLRHAAARRDGAIVFQQRIVIAVMGVFVLMLDQEPVGALAAAILVILHAHEHPAAMQVFAVETEFQIAFLQHGFGGTPSGSQ